MIRADWRGVPGATTVARHGTAAAAGVLVGVVLSAVNTVLILIREARNR